MKTKKNRMLILTISIALPCSAFACYDFLEKSSATTPGKVIYIICDFVNGCVLDPTSYCQDVISYSPPVKHPYYCHLNSEYYTGYRCVSDTVSQTTQYNSGTPYCDSDLQSQTGCKTGCMDWDTGLAPIVWTGDV
jgi:hypothetical protein